MVALTLPFAMIDCERCEVRRQTRFACPDCGKRPRNIESDSHTQFRHRATQQGVRARSSSVAAPTQTAEELLDSGRLAPLIDQIFQAGESIANEASDGGETFAEVAREIAGLAAWVEEVDALRPLANFNEGVATAVGGLVDVFDVVTQVLIAETIPEAQELQVVLQRCLENAAAGLDVANRVKETVHTIVDSTDPVAGWLSIAIDRDPLKAVAHGEKTFQTHVGWKCGPAAALPAAVHEIVAETIGDRERFWRLTKRHSDFLETKADRIGAVLRSPVFMGRSADVVHDLWSAASRAASIPEAETDRQEATELLEAGHLIFEQAMKFHLGVGVALSTKRDFEETQRCDVSDLNQVATDQRWSIAPDLGRADLRNAFAHRSYRVSGSRVTLSQPRDGSAARSLSIPELRHEILEMVETTAAMDLALTAVAEREGLSAWAGAQGVYLLRPLLSGLGWRDVETAGPSTDGTVTVRAHVVGEIPLAFLAVAVPAVATTAVQLRLVLQDPSTGKSVDARVPTEPFVSWDEESDVGLKEISYIRLISSIAIDDVPLVQRSQAAKLIATRAYELTSKKAVPFPEVRLALGRFRDLAAELGLDELQREIRRAIRFRGDHAAGLAVDGTSLDPLLAIATSEIPPIRASLTPSAVTSREPSD